MDPDQAQQNVRPDLDPNCSQSLQQMAKFAASRQRFHGHFFTNANSYFIIFYFKTFIFSVNASYVGPDTGGDNNDQSK